MRQPGLRAAAAVAAGLLLSLAAAGTQRAGAQEAPQAAALTGTLRAIADRGSILLGHRESSVPFSYLDAAHRPVGYSVDLCLAVAESVRELLGPAIGVEWRTVTPESRIPEVVTGRIDLECGSTTSTAERARQVAFSPIIFVAGTRLLVPRDSGIRSLADLAGRTLVVTAGTTNAEALRNLAEKQRITLNLVTAPDHAQAFARLIGGEAEAFATDDVLLHGLVATTPGGRRFRVAGPLLSYEPYGLMFRREDPEFAALVGRSLERLAESGELRRIYDRWFARRLPGGDRLDIPMSAQLAELFRMMGAPD